MTYLAIFLAALAFSVALGKLLKRNLEINYPRCDDEGEVEAFLADRLAVCLKEEGQPV